MNNLPVEIKLLEAVRHCRPFLAACAIEAGAGDGPRGDPELVLTTAIYYGHEIMVRFLLAHGFDPNLSDVECWTPLHFVAIRDSESILRLLIDNGADIEAQDMNQQTPLMAEVIGGRLFT